MKKLIILCFFFSIGSTISAQENDQQYKGTIKIEKKGQLAKVQFDNVNYRLVGIDRYGNVMDSAVIEFQMSVTINGIFYKEKTVGSALSYQMQQLMGKCDQTTKLVFENIKAKDRNGNVIDMPKFQFALGAADENNE
jgi:hypothetical protein